MTEWTVVGVIVVLIGLIAAIAKPLISLNTAITRLNTLVEGLREDLRQVTADNKSSHARLWDRVNEHSELLNDHETRLQAFENKYR